jgi:hypothetical protein
MNNVLIFNNRVTSTVKGEGQNDCMCEPWNDMVFTFQRGVVNSLPGCTKIPYFFIFFYILNIFFDFPYTSNGIFFIKNMGVYEYFELTTPRFPVPLAVRCLTGINISTY